MMFVTVSRNLCMLKKLGLLVVGHVRNGSKPSGSNPSVMSWDHIIHCTLLQSVRAHQQPINSLQTEGGRVVTASQDHTLKVILSFWRGLKYLDPLFGHGIFMLSPGGWHLGFCNYNGFQLTAIIFSWVWFYVLSNIQFAFIHVMLTLFI